MTIELNKAKDLIINSDLEGLIDRESEIVQQEKELNKYIEYLEDIEFGRLNNLDVSYKRKYRD